MTASELNDAVSEDNELIRAQLMYGQSFRTSELTELREEFLKIGVFSCVGVLVCVGLCMWACVCVLVCVCLCVCAWVWACVCVCVCVCYERERECVCVRVSRL